MSTARRERSTSGVPVGVALHYRDPQYQCMFDPHGRTVVRPPYVQKDVTETGMSFFNTAQDIYRLPGSWTSRRLGQYGHRIR